MWYHLPSSLLPRYFVKYQCAPERLHIHISENNLRHIRWHLSHEFFLYCVFVFLPRADVITTLL